MKLSEIYERAAEAVASEYEHYACNAIKHRGARTKFSLLFRPDIAPNDSCAWGILWGWDRPPTEYPTNAGPHNDRVQDCRVLALLFAAAIARSEGK